MRTEKLWSTTRAIGSRDSPRTGSRNSPLTCTGRQWEMSDAMTPAAQVLQFRVTMPQTKNSEHVPMVISVDTLAPKYVVSPHSNGTSPSSGQNVVKCWRPHKWAMMIATWTNMAKCTVVYLHIYGKSTLIDLLYTPARGNHKKCRQARLITQHHQITRLETLWSYILTPYRHLATT